MGVTASRTENHIILMLDGDLTARSADELKNAFISALSGSPRVEVKFGTVTAVDLSCIQVLCSAHRSAMRAGRSLAIAGPRPLPYLRALGAAGYSRRAGCRLDCGNSCLWVDRGQDGQPAPQTCGR